MSMCTSLFKSPSHFFHPRKAILAHIMDQQNPSSSSKADRKTIEKNRRSQMKNLFTQLFSLVPLQSKEGLSLPDQVGEATNYIKEMQVKLEKMKEKRDSYVQEERDLGSYDCAMGSLVVPHVDVQKTGSALQVVLVTGSDRPFVFSQVIRLLHEEGAEVVNASFSVVNNTIFHTLHSKVGESESVPGDAAARISERLKKCVLGLN